MTSNRFSPTGLIIFTVFILTLLSSACNNKKQLRGLDLVPKKVMIQMMVDMHLIDGMTNDVSYYHKYNPNDSIDLYGTVFEKYEVSRDDFYSTMEEYASVPKLLDEIYSEILKELNLMQEELDKAKQDEIDNNPKKPFEEFVRPEIEKKNRKRNTSEPVK